MMWSYYGAKTNVIMSYPKPIFSKIIEPFAGSARYALRYFDREILLVDKYEPIIKIWKWLQQCSPGDVTGLPRIKEGENINTFQFDCEEARLLMGFCIGFGSPSPRHIATPRARHRPNSQNFTLNRIASNLFKIKHWKFIHGSYVDLPNEPATWFIDPPYQFGGQHYPCSSRHIDFNHLREWCVGREGQVLVCENSKADWMDFQVITKQDVLSGKNYECLWTNGVVNYPNKQLEMYTLSPTTEVVERRNKTKTYDKN